MMIELVHIVDNVFITHHAISVHTDQNVSMLPSFACMCQMPR